MGERPIKKFRHVIEGQLKSMGEIDFGKAKFAVHAFIEERQRAMKKPILWWQNSEFKLLLSGSCAFAMCGVKRMALLPSTENHMRGRRREMKDIYKTNCKKPHLNFASCI